MGAAASFLVSDADIGRDPKAQCPRGCHNVNCDDGMPSIVVADDDIADLVDGVEADADDGVRGRQGAMMTQEGFMVALRNMPPPTPDLNQESFQAEDLTVTVVHDAVPDMQDAVQPKAAKKTGARACVRGGGKGGRTGRGKRKRT